MRNLKFLWLLFEWASGLRVNFDKTELFYTGSNVAKAASLASILECKVGVFPVRYLGLPLSDRALKKEDWRGLIGKIQCRIDGWQAKLLSRGGRLILVNAVLANLPIYFFSMFKAPKWVTKGIEALRRDFFWAGGLKETGKGCLVAWKNVCRSKEAGGLGILDLATMNDALLVKWWWRLFSAPMLQWNKLIRALYYSRRSPLREGRSFRPASQWWRNILSTRDIFKGGVSYELGVGNLIRFWDDRWCGEVTLQSRFSDVYNAVTNKEIKICLCADHSGWDWETILSGVDLGRHPDSGRVTELKEALEEITIGQETDRAIWRWMANGRFSVKSTYRLLNDGGVRDNCSFKIWTLRMPTKVRIFVWLALKKRIQTADNLAKRGWTGNLLCLLCGTEPETTDHLLTGCVYTRYLSWMVSNELVCGNVSDDTRSVWENGMGREGTDRANKKLVMLSAIWWVVWCIRNKVAFHNTSTDPLRAVTWVNRLGDSWDVCRGQRSG